MKDYHLKEELKKRVIQKTINIDPLLGRIDIRNLIRAWQNNWIRDIVSEASKYLTKYFLLKFLINVIKPKLNEPIFIVGMPHSGTTLLAKLLGRSQEIINLSEYNELFYPKGNYLINQNNDVFEDIEDVQRERRILDSAFFMYRFYHRGGAKRILNKSPMNIVNYRYLRALYPDSKIICIVRNPLAYARSSSMNVTVEERRDRALKVESRVDRMPGPKTASSMEYLDDDILKQFIGQWNYCNIKIMRESQNDSKVRFIDYSDLVENGQDTLDVISKWLEISEIDISEVKLFNSDLKHLNLMSGYSDFLYGLNGIEWYVNDWNRHDKRLRP